MRSAPTTLVLAALLAVLLAPAPARGTASEWAKNPQSQVRLLSSWVVAPQSGELMLGLEFRVSPGWHVYWKNSGDAGFPPAVTFQPERILGKPELLWPRPNRYELPGGLVAFGYEDHVVYPVLAVIEPGSILPPAPEDRKPDGESFKITAEVDYLVCEADCIPYRYTLTMDQKVGFPTLGDPEASPLLDGAFALLPKTLSEVPDVKVSTVLDLGRPEPDFEVRLLNVQLQPGKTDLFLEASELFDAGKPRAGSFPGGVVFHVSMKRRDVSKPLPKDFEIGWTATQLAKTGETFDLAVRHPVQVEETAAAPSRPKPPARSPALLARLLLWVFLGGLLLNLAPNVLALLVGETLALKGAAAGPREGAAAAATGVVGACWALAGISIISRGTAFSWQASGWGAQLQEPALSALLAVLSALLALNLWGLLEIPLARNAAGTGTGRHLLTGVFTTLLALAWPLPLLQEPVGYALAGGPATVCAVYSVLGFGLAFPYLVLMAAPGLARRLPEPGPWLPRLREGLGFLAAVGAFWLLYTLSRQVRPEGLAWIELSLLGLALFAWLRSREGTGPTLRLALVLGLTLCAATALWMAHLNRYEAKTGLPSSPETSPGEITEPLSNPISGG